MLKTIILLSFISLVVSENTTSLSRNNKCYYKRSESDKEVIDLFAKVTGEDGTEKYVLGKCEYGLCRDWWGNEVLDYCKESVDNCKDYKEGLCRGDAGHVEDWSPWQWVAWACIIIASCCLCCSIFGGELNNRYSRINN